MEKIFVAKWNMTYTFLSYVDVQGNVAIYQGFKPFFTGIATMHKLKDVWGDLLLEAQDDSTGVTFNKEQAKLDMANYWGMVCSSALAYGIKQKDQEMQNNWSFTEASINKLEENLAVTTCDDIAKFTDANKAALVDYGIDDTVIALGRAKTIVFKNFLGKANAIISSVNAAKGAIAELVNGPIDFEYQQLDSLAKGLYFKNEQKFVDGYFNARKLHHLPTSHTELEVTIIDKDTKKPIEGAKLLITELKLSALSNYLGVADIKEFKGGRELHILVSALGYKDYAVVKDIIKGHKSGFVVEMEKV